MRSLIRTTISAAALATVLAGGLTACGGDSGTAADPAGASSSATSSAPASDEPSESPAPSSSSSSPPVDAPACSKVWKAGATLARGYQGCVQDGAFVERDLLPCSSGQRLARYADHFYAAMGGRVYETESVLDKDRRYRDAVAVCRG